MAIDYVTGDATEPVGDGNKIIAHICNDIGGWGAGFVLALSQSWLEPEQGYHRWYESGEGFALGQVQFVQVEMDVWVANMIAQQDVVADAQGVPPIRYEALEMCLQKVAVKAKQLGGGVHMPRIGCGLAGGKWEKIEPLIEKTLVAAGIVVTVYDL